MLKLIVLWFYLTVAQGGKTQFSDFKEKALKCWLALGCLWTDLFQPLCCYSHYQTPWFGSIVNSFENHLWSHLLVALRNNYFCSS